jgi:hypothetical protein
MKIGSQKEVRKKSKRSLGSQEEVRWKSGINLGDRVRDRVEDMVSKNEGMFEE